MSKTYAPPSTPLGSRSRNLRTTRGEGEVGSRGGLVFVTCDIFCDFEEGLFRLLWGTNLKRESSASSNSQFYNINSRGFTEHGNQPEVR
jgi:hypothetical protein